LEARGEALYGPWLVPSRYILAAHLEATLH
jgi:hypothetical protein